MLTFCENKYLSTNLVVYSVSLTLFMEINNILIDLPALGFTSMHTVCQHLQPITSLLSE